MSLCVRLSSDDTARRAAAGVALGRRRAGRRRRAVGTPGALHRRERHARRARAAQPPHDENDDLRRRDGRVERDARAAHQVRRELTPDASTAPRRLHQPPRAPPPPPDRGVLSSPPRRSLARRLASSTSRLDRRASPSPRRRPTLRSGPESVSLAATHRYVRNHAPGLVGKTALSEVRVRGLAARRAAARCQTALTHRMASQECLRRGRRSAPVALPPLASEGGSRNRNEQALASPRALLVGGPTSRSPPPSPPRRFAPQYDAAVRATHASFLLSAAGDDDGSSSGGARTRDWAAWDDGYGGDSSWWTDAPRATRRSIL